MNSEQRNTRNFVRRNPLKRRILRLLDTVQPLTAGHIAQSLTITYGCATGVLHRLRDDGLIRSVPLRVPKKARPDCIGWETI